MSMTTPKPLPPQAAPALPQAEERATDHPSGRTTGLADDGDHELSVVERSQARLVVDVHPGSLSEDAILTAAYSRAEDCFVVLGRGPGGALRVRMEPKAAGWDPELALATFRAELALRGAEVAAQEARRGQLAEVVREAVTGLAPETPSEQIALPFHYRQVGEDVLVSNDLGDWRFLSQPEFQRFVRGEVRPGEPLWDALASKGLVGGKLLRKEAVANAAQRLAWVGQGPHLHIIVVTLRCDHTCRYCHASRVPMSRSDRDMTPEVAERVVDTIFESPSGFVTIEFQGGEPLANYPVVQHIIEYAENKNKLYDKKLTFALVTNMSLMTEDKLDFLVEHKVEISTSLDGPKELHNYNRLLGRGDSWAQAVDWIRKINTRYREMGLDPHLYRVEAINTTTKASLPRWKEIIDTYLDVGCRSLFLRALNPFGFATATAKQIGYSMEAWLDYYRQSLDYIVQLNRDGTDVLERNAAIFLTKMLTGHDPNFLDIRSPCGAGIGQVAYNWDGSVYTCDEGRMVAEMGDDLFKMGTVTQQRWPELIRAEPVRALAMASTLDGQPGCATCVYKAYCGSCPVHNYSEQGSLAGRMGESSWCQKHMGIMDHLFGLLRQGQDDGELQHILERWTLERPRTHFVQECAAH